MSFLYRYCLLSIIDDKAYTLSFYLKGNWGRRGLEIYVGLKYEKK